MQSYIDFGFKQELIRIYAFGYMIKRQFLKPEYHLVFNEENIKGRKLMSDIFMFKNLKECNAIYGILEPRRKNKASLEEFKGLSAS